MHGSFNDLSERLYLQTDSSGDISVPCSELTQHQIDGVRFLFSQYKKEKPGVIINLPPACGGSVQVAVFISAVLEKLKRPVLILYEDDKDKERWLERFSKWTNIQPDSIEVDTSNPYLRKEIFISNVTDITNLTRRYWGIVVVKSDKFYNFLLRLPMSVDYKIWITAQDFKKDKPMLRSVVTWIYPTEPLLQQYLDDKAPAMFRDEIPNDMLLDLLLEDILFTRRNLIPLGAPKRKLDTDIQTLPWVSKKNKDATGKKIKRSKKPPEMPSTSEIQIENVFSLKPNNDNTFESLNVIPKSSNGDNATAISTIPSINEEESKMDVESFIRDNEPLVSDNTLNFAGTHLDDTPQLSETSSPQVEVESTDSSSVDFACAVNDIVQNENNIWTNKRADSLNVDAELVKENEPNLTPELSQPDDKDVKNQIESKKIDVSKTEIQNEPNVSHEEVIKQTESKNINVSEPEVQETLCVGDEEVKDQVESKEIDVSKTEIQKTFYATDKEIEDQIETKEADVSKTEIQKSFYATDKEIEDQIESKEADVSKTEIQNEPNVSDEEVIEQTESKNINISETEVHVTLCVSDGEVKDQAELRETDVSKTTIQKTYASDTDIEDQIEWKKVDVTKTEIQKILGTDVRDGENTQVTKINIENRETGEVKTEKESSDGEGGAGVQESKLEVSTSLKKETESFDAKMQEFEEKALRKYKGSVLDILF